MTSSGIGTKSIEQALADLQDMTTDAEAISLDEHQARIEKATRYMQAQGIDAFYLNAGTNLSYFTGLDWYPSERLVGALLTQQGELCYLVPDFEIDSIKERLLIDAPIYGWHEHESPYQLLVSKFAGSTLAVDEATAFFMVDGMQKAAPALNIINGGEVSAHCRMHKSAAEIALIQKAMTMTMEVHKAAASILHEGITTLEVERFINQAHQKVGASGSYFCIVLFGVASSFPHGVKDPQVLKKGDLVLIDTGCKVKGYLSDITRTYAFGEVSDKIKAVWASEKKAQLAAFAAAQLGKPCGDVDAAARKALEEDGLGPDYTLPGLPHRTGHGLGMDIHEWPYLVKDNPLPLASGMVFSNEPMIVVPGEFGVRLEDHFYMTDSGPRWFTEPAVSIDKPFG
ncbi:M24 family metallopeptidase [Gallaecimonas mangrovi]|uniref:M24 family metallopeptidase n=1 Tax=Gallaecimonas mangrovi TaxID=2291597 RepID=UPI000E200473|nr:Xaa-Pro peptidase family protein [Gallaecimonas mangrovi]